MLAAGRDVAVLCQGDPFFYGSFMYLFARLAERVPVRDRAGRLVARPPAPPRPRWPLAARDDALDGDPGRRSPTTSSTRRLAAADAAAIIKLGRHFARVRDVARRGSASPTMRVTSSVRAWRASACCRSTRSMPASVPYFAMILLHRRGEAGR